MSSTHVKADVNELDFFILPRNLNDLLNAASRVMYRDTFYVLKYARTCVAFLIFVSFHLLASEHV